MTKDRLLDVFCRTFELSTVSESISQKNSDKWDSLNHINLVVEIETEFDIMLEPEDISEMIDFESVLRIVERKLV